MRHHDDDVRPYDVTANCSLNRNITVVDAVFELWKISWGLNFSTVGTQPKLWYSLNPMYIVAYIADPPRT